MSYANLPRCRGTATTLILAAAAISMAAPFLATEKSMTGEDLSLARIDRLRLIVASVPDPIKKRGVNREELEGLSRRALAGAGIHVVDDWDESVPTLELLVLVADDEKAAPEAQAFCVYLTFKQRVLVERIDRKLDLPTWSTLDMKVKAPHEVARSAREAIHKVMNHFVNMTTMATRRVQP
jgi:hypothetical protein